MTREYLAIYDNGHGYGDFTFSSSHCKGSKGNMADALETIGRRYGRRASESWSIIEIQRVEV